MTVLPELFTGQRIVSANGFTMIVHECEINDSIGWYNSSAVHQGSVMQDPVRQIKKWCRNYCGHTWGFSETHMSTSRTENRFRTVKRTYFAFKDDSDRLSMIMKFGDIAEVVSTWGTSLTFNIYVIGD